MRAAVCEGPGVPSDDQEDVLPVGPLSTHRENPLLFPGDAYLIGLQPAPGSVALNESALCFRHGPVHEQRSLR